MLIEVRGVGFVNKGAELMLHAALQRLRAAFPEACFAMLPSSNEDYLRRSCLGLYHKVGFRRFGVSLGSMVPARRREYYRRRYGLVFDEDVDVVLDASGFGYTDQFGPQPAVVMAKYVGAWRRRGTKVILLPQAMGPFTSRAIRKAFAYVATNADIVFCRDRMSYQHVVGLVGERDNIQQAPDFTNLVDGVAPDDVEKYRGRFCVVPNYRMVQKTLGEVQGAYVAFCVKCLQYLIKQGEEPFILVHEGDGDRRLAECIAADVGQVIEIVTEADALRAKGILAVCACVIGSRFHALVSALSQGVPALATGWSHKYDMLFEEYGIEDACVPTDVTEEVLRERLSKYLDPDRRPEVLSALSIAAAEQKKRSEAMWDSVIEVLS